MCRCSDKILFRKFDLKRIMIFINPWAYYHPDDIPDLNPHTDEEMVGCIAGICGFIIATIIHVLLVYLCFTLTNGILRPILITIGGVLIYPMLVICLMELSFKIGEKITIKKKKK